MTPDIDQQKKATEPSWLGLTRTEWFLGLTVLLAVGLLVHPYRAQQASRYALTAAVVERGTVVLDDYADVLGRDRAVRDGHVYSDKAPGQPLMAVPFYAAGKLVGVEEATGLRVEGNLGLWWVTLWSAALPGAALAVMMYRRARKFQCRGALLGSVSAFAGTILLPFSALLFGHVLAAALLYGSFLLLAGEGSTRRLATAGVVAGFGVAVEYTVVLGVLVLGIYAIRRHGWPALMYLVGGIPAAVALASYNAAAFGDPFTVSYQYTAFDEVTESSRQVFAMFGPGRWENARRLLVEGRGLILATPIVLVAMAGAVSRLRRGLQIDAAMGLVMFLAFIWLPIFWGNPWGGASPGPRYITPALAFLAVPVMWAWQRWPRLTVFASGVSILTMVTATVTDPILSRHSINGLNTWMGWLLDGEVTPSVFTIGMGDLGWVVHGAILATAMIFLGRFHRASCEMQST